MAQGSTNSTQRTNQDVISDANNSSTSNLGIGTNYTGTATDTLGVAGLQVSILCNEAGTLFIDQSQDGTNWDISDSFAITANVGYETQLQAMGDYYRSRFVRTSTAAATTTFRIESLLVPNLAILPRALTQSGNLKVALQESTAIQTIQGYQPGPTSQTGITGTGAQAAVAVTGYNVATVTLRTFTGTTPSISFKLQASDDNQTTWGDIQGSNNATGSPSITFTQSSALAAGTAAPTVDYTIGAYTHIRVNVTAISGTSATAAFGIGVQSMPYEATPAAVVNGFDGTNYQRIKTLTDGSQVVKEVRSTTPTQTSPSVTNSSTAVVASNANRLGATVYNESGAICYLKLGATASVTSYSVQIAIGGYYEVPFAYTGQIDGITASGTATLRVTELT